MKSLCVLDKFIIMIIVLTIIAIEVFFYKFIAVAVGWTLIGIGFFWIFSYLAILPLFACSFGCFLGYIETEYYKKLKAKSLIIAILSSLLVFVTTGTFFTIIAPFGIMVLGTEIGGIDTF